jgi:hypothetical protein
MRIVVRKIHTWLGLLSFSILLVFGITGLEATVAPHPERRPKPDVRVWYEDFSSPPNLTDKQLADHIQENYRMYKAHTIPQWALARDPENNLRLDYYSVNGRTRVTVLEKERRLRFEEQRTNLGQFINHLHATTIRSSSPDLRVRLWTWYVEFSIWSLLAMTVSGLYLWLSSRPRWRWAIVSFAAGTGAFCVLLWLTR